MDGDEAGGAGPGSVIKQQYMLRERIGDGGMGVVFRAEQVALARPVAVKFLHPELLAVPGLLERFRREAHAASRLSHPNTVAVIDFGVADGGAPFLVMEYVQGDTLAHRVRTEGPPPVPRAVALVGQILAALEEAHAAGVVHADVKSDNVLVQRLANGAERAKVVDFGLARLREDDEAHRDETLVSGTPEYMAPELIRGEPPTAASDLYAVGVILYELLTGATPFAGGPTLEVLERHLHDVAVPPSLRRPDREIPIAVERTCLRALAKAPGDRFADAVSFAASLVDALPAPGTVRCPGCGGPRPDSARFCPDCGASATPQPVSRDTPTQPIDVGASSTERLRAAIGQAILRGDVAEIVAGYLALARTLVGLRRATAAIAELEEAIDLVSGGEGPDTGRASRHLSRLLVALARIHDQNGDRARALRIAGDAVRHVLP